MNYELYAVLECKNTLELCTEGSRAGFGSWIPVEHILTVDRKKKPVVRTRAAVPGYVFVPFPLLNEFKHWANNQGHNVRVMVSTSGDPHTKKVDYSMQLKPAQIPVEKLHEMARVLEEFAEQSRQQKEPAKLQKGDKVIIRIGLFQDRTGVVQSCGTSSVKILVNTKYMRLPRSFVEKIA